MIASWFLAHALQRAEQNLKLLKNNKKNNNNILSMILSINYYSLSMILSILNFKYTYI